MSKRRTRILGFGLDKHLPDREFIGKVCRRKHEGESMKEKAIVIGCPGSGKTTFSESLHKRTGLPLFYLDAIWHKPDRTHISREEFDKSISERSLMGITIEQLK